MQPEPDMTADLARINPIRIETALPRFPIHRLAKHGNVTIDIREQSENGEAAIRWEISHNSKYGQPGPLAYKLDTLIVNRRIEEASRPIPKIIRLGSLREITQELGISTHNIEKIKQALYQNAFAAITAKIRYRQSDGKERGVEIGGTRYGVVFTGETLPDGRPADAVYIVLHDFYREILDNAVTRPLDYDYLKDLAPTAQRLYELLSYQVYAALKHDRARAKLVYSEFCTYAPQTRYTEFDKVKKQMHKINSVHKSSGYIAKVDFHQTTAADGKPDWVMLYMPGLKARAEYQAFTKRAVMPSLLIGLSQSSQANASSGQEQFALDFPAKRKARSRAKVSEKPEPSPLIAMLVQRGVTEATAAELVGQYPERIQPQIDILDGFSKKKLEKIDDPAAYLVVAIRKDHAVPKGHVSKAEREQQAAAKRQREEDAAAARRQQRERDAAIAAERRAITAYWDALTPEQQAAHDRAAIAQASAEQLKLIEPGPMKRYGMGIIRDGYARKLLQDQGKLSEFGG